MCRSDQNYPFKERILIMEISYLQEIDDFEIFSFGCNKSQQIVWHNKLACKNITKFKEHNYLLVWKPMAKLKFLVQISKRITS